MIESIERVSERQVIHDERQITKPEQLEEGKVYEIIHISREGRIGKGNRLKIIYLNLLTKMFRAKLTCLDHECEKGCEGIFKMADYGIVPLGSGLYNVYTYLIPAS